MKYLKLRMSIFKDALVCQVLEQDGTIKLSSYILDNPSFTISEDDKTLFLPITENGILETDPLITESCNPVFLRKSIVKGIEKILFNEEDNIIGKKVKLVNKDSSVYYKVLGKTTSGLFVLEDQYENLIKAHKEEIIGTLQKSQSGDVFVWRIN